MDAFERELKARFAQAADLNCRSIQAAGLACSLLFLDGLSSGGDIAEFVLRPLRCLASPLTSTALFETLLQGGAEAASVSACADPADAACKLLNGFCVLCIPGAGALAFEVKSPQVRGPSEPEVESTTRGPKDAFAETMRTNTALLRRHLRTEKLCIWESVVGRESRTNVSLLWLEGVAAPETVARMKRRLQELEVRDLLTPAAVEHLLPGQRGTPFPLLQYTERTDKLATGLLSGRVGVFVDGLPVGYLAPVNLGWLLQSAEDRDTDPFSARFLKALRLIALAAALLLPALYVAMAEFHQEMLPTALLEAIIESKQKVPFPTAVEVLGLLTAFELLQEAGLSAPKAVSQPVSIIGGLVVGTAAVEANLISPAALILVSAAGICGFALPGKSFSDAIRLFRFGLTLCAALAGLFGLTLGLLALLIHLSGLNSFGRAWLAPYSELERIDRMNEKSPEKP
ncbi:MAG: spore germination protein [Oscillospiraceae bacterium]|nr:spore germination protein [Oscillospiraceae bacterium]